MTGRGDSALRPPTPPDLTLELRPVPRKQRFASRSFGPGAASDIQQTVTSARELSTAAQDNAELLSSEKLQADDDGNFQQHIECEKIVDYWDDGRPCEPDPLWGFCLFLTDYASTTTAKVPRAVENMLKVQQQRLSTSPRWADMYSKELYHRLKFDVVGDQETLDGASLDRVRACSRAYVKSLEICPEDSLPSPARYKVCLVLDGGAVEMLASLTFSEDGVVGDPRQYKLRAVYIRWERSEATSSLYRGVKDLEIDSLPYDLILKSNVDSIY